MLLETPRLHVQQITLEDAPFFLELLNTPSYKKYIADRNIKSLKDAESYLSSSILKHHQDFGYGYYKIILKSTGAAIGIVGYVNRKELPAVDIGFALLPAYEHQGFAFEASAALLEFGKSTLHLPQVAGIVQEDNPRSIRLLEKLGLRYHKKITPFDKDEPLLLYLINWNV